MGKKEKYNIAVVGAMGMVGSQMIATLERRQFPVDELRPLDVPSNEGKKISFHGKAIEVKTAKAENFEGIDIAIFSAGGDAALELAPQAVEKGAIVVDNSSAWRMDPRSPLVVPEVNPQDLDWHNGIIANPNCSTIQMVVALKPLHDYASIKRVVVSTYQAVSGSGMKAFEGLKAESREYLESGDVKTPLSYQQPIAFNCLPHIDVFQEGGYTKEEYKMVNETTKIMNDDSILVSPTCVRVPVFYGHSESINLETEKKLTVEKTKELLGAAKSIKVVDDPDTELYPMPFYSENEDLTMVGRIREDNTTKNGLNLWVVSNNIRKGAALNAVQVAETLIERNLV